MATGNSLTFDNIDQGNAYKLTFDKQTEDVFVGSMLFSYDKNPKQFVTYCVDLSHFITKGQNYGVNVIQTDTLPSSNVYRLAGDIVDAGIGSANTANKAAALQIAVWDEVYGKSGFALSGVSSTVKNLANQYLTNGLKSSGNAIYFQENSGKGQSQITATPEPASYAVLGIGAFGIFFRRRRR